MPSHCCVSCHVPAASVCALQEAGIPKKLAPTIGIAVDHRRRNRSLESLQVRDSKQQWQQVQALVREGASSANFNVFYNGYFTSTEWVGIKSKVVSGLQQRPQPGWGQQDVHTQQRAGTSGCSLESLQVCDSRQQC
jgi:hypothetical protein